MTDTYSFQELIDITRTVIAAFDAAEQRPWAIEATMIELMKGPPHTRALQAGVRRPRFALDMPLLSLYNNGMEKQREIKITVRFPADLIEALPPLAELEDRSLNGEIVQAVREYLKRKHKRSE